LSYFSCQLIFVIDQAGDEHDQLWLLDLQSSLRTPIANNPANYHHLGGFSPCGTLVSFLQVQDGSANSLPKFSVFVYDFESKSSTLIFEFMDVVGVSLGPISADKHFVVVGVDSDTVPSDMNVYLLSLSLEDKINPTLRQLTPHDGSTDPSFWDVNRAKYEI
jgi:hypothetical protein